MIYEMYLDDKPLFYPGDEECVIIEPEIELKMNEAGTAKLSVPSINPRYDEILNRKSMLSVLKDGEEVFYGEVRNYTRSFDMSKEVTAVGALTFLHDSIQPQHDYGKCTAVAFLTAVLAEHNAQMVGVGRKQIELGVVDVEHSVTNTKKVTDNRSTLEEIRENLLSDYDGVLKLHRVDGVLTLDFLSLSNYNGEACHQDIVLGENVMDYTEEFSTDALKTHIIPYGARLENQPSGSFEKRLDITSASTTAMHPANANYVKSDNATIERFGSTWGVINYDTIDSAETLRQMAELYLTSAQFEKAVFKLSAVDLSAVNVDIDTIQFGDRVHVEVPIFGMDSTLSIIEMTMKPLQPEDERIVISGNLRKQKQTLTGRVSEAAKIVDNIRNTIDKEVGETANVIMGEIENIMKRYEGQYGGYKLSEYDSNGLWLRDLYMDQPDKDDATNIMEISMQGIRFSNNGYGAASSNVWNSAWSINGNFVSNEIFAQIVFASLIKTGRIENIAGTTWFDLDTGQIMTRNLNPNDEYVDADEVIKTLLINNGYISATIRHPSSGGNTRVSGLLDMNATYADGMGHVALRAEKELHLQVGGGMGQNPAQEATDEVSLKHGLLNYAGKHSGSNQYSSEIRADKLTAMEQVSTNTVNALTINATDLSVLNGADESDYVYLLRDQPTDPNVGWVRCKISHGILKYQ